VLQPGASGVAVCGLGCGNGGALEPLLALGFSGALESSSSSPAVAPPLLEDDEDGGLWHLPWKQGSSRHSSFFVHAPPRATPHLPSALHAPLMHARFATSGPHAPSSDGSG
jgi:hypothetical protein